MSAKEPLPTYPADPSVKNTRRTPRRHLTWVVLMTGLLVAGLGFTIERYLHGSEQVSLRTAVVERGDVERTVTALGKLKPKDYVDVGTQVSGQLRRVHRKIGDRVQKGELIAEIDPTVYEIRVRNTAANLENLRAVRQQQQAELELARKQLVRSRNLGTSRAISEQSLEEAEAAVQVAEARLAATAAQIKAAEATYAGDQANLGYTKIYAPISGTVVSESAVEGQTVNASQSAPVIVRVADLETMTVWAEVSEADVVKLRPDLPAYFTTLGMPERRWEGTVRQIMPTPEIVNDVVLYNVLIDVDNREQLLMSEMTVQVFFLLEQARDVPLVPTAALQPGTDGAPDRGRVQVMGSGGPIEREVRLGVRSRSLAEVIEGLAPGDVVVLGSAAATGPAPGAPRRGPRL